MGTGETKLEARVKAALDAHRDVFLKLREMVPQVVKIGRVLKDALSRGNKILVAGNGGSAADAQHFVAELVGRYMVERRALAGLALTTDTSIMTAVGNDYGFREVFSRQVDGLGKAGDVFIGISTSGNSANLLTALEVAAKKGLVSIALLGKTGGKMAALADHTFVVPSDETPRIQEAHEWVLHTWCDLIDVGHA